MQLNSTITCPACGHAEEETMPQACCVFFYACKGCGIVLRAHPGNCCVYCSYGSLPCPPVQQARASPGTQCCRSS